MSNPHQRKRCKDCGKMIGCHLKHDSLNIKYGMVRRCRECVIKVLANQGDDRPPRTPFQYDTGGGRRCGYDIFNGKKYEIHPCRFPVAEVY